MTSGLPGRDAERRSGSGTLTDWIRARAKGVLDPVGRSLGGLGIHPNAITLVGFLLQAGVAALFLVGRIRLGGVLLLVVAPLDALDGAVARAIGKDGPLGAFLDSTLDRVSDAVLILGLAAYQYQRGEIVPAVLFVVALVGALLVSYTRARAESLGVPCKVGLATRLERVMLVALLSAVGLTTALAWALALLSGATFLQRVAHVYLALSRQD